jgi:hypothetical protein
METETLHAIGLTGNGQIPIIDTYYEVVVKSVNQKIHDHALALQFHLAVHKRARGRFRAPVQRGLFDTRR